MTLIKSISGIRGTIGGKKGNNLTPIDIVESVAGFGTWLKRKGLPEKIVVGRDGRISGQIVSNLAINTLLAMGIDVINLDYSTTPTVEMAVPLHNAGAGIIFTASHNPKQWNALKFLNNKGEFISETDGHEILEIIKMGDISYSETDNLGSYSEDNNAFNYHIGEILKYKYVNVEAIKAAKFNVVADCINSTGALMLPLLFDRLDVEYTLINDRNFGNFEHNPEPLPAHLTELSTKVVEMNADLGISVDPDVDRLAFVCEDGSMFGEEYTLVAVADYILSKESGNSVSNLSSSRALADVTHKHGGSYYASAVGEVNVVNEMKRVNAVIGGEGNGGVIVPGLHYGRDAIAGIVIFLSHLAETQMKMTELKSTYPAYVIIKDKIELTPDFDFSGIVSKIKDKFKSEKLNDIDGIKIDFREGWVHLRKSNTEPIVRIYAESTDEKTATNLINKVKSLI